MIKKITISIVLLFVLNSCNSKTHENEIREEEYSVYNTVIDSICSRPIDIYQISDCIVIRDTTFDGRFSSGRYHVSDFYSFRDDSTFDKSTIEHWQVYSFLSNFVGDNSMASLQKDYDSVSTIHSLLISEKIETQMKHYLLPKKKIKYLFNIIHFDSNKYPDSLAWKTNGHVYLSRVGLSENKKYALVKFVHSSGEGYDEYIALLKKTTNKWVILKLLSTWAI